MSCYKTLTSINKTNPTIHNQHNYYYYQNIKVEEQRMINTLVICKKKKTNI